MRRVVLLLFSCCCAVVSAQVKVHEGAGILLRLEQTLDTADETPDQEVRFVVAQDFVVDGHLLAKKGAAAPAVLNEIESGRRWGRGGRLVVIMKDIELTDGERLSLNSSLEEGSARFGFALAGDAMSLLSPLGAAMHGIGAYRDHGYEMVIPEGTLMVALSAKDVTLDASHFATATPVALPAPLRKGELREMIVTGNVPDALIELDHGAPVKAPHTFQVKGGLHDVVVRATGFDGWERAVPVEGTPLKVEFQLDREEPKQEKKK